MQADMKIRKRSPRNREGVCKMLKKRCVVSKWVFAVFLFPALALYSVAGAQEVRKDTEYYIEEGMGHFKKGYYEALPNGRKTEAAEDLERAAVAFKRAIAKRKDSVQARRHLARVYYVQKRYLAAAEQYREVSILNPSDIDTHVITALAYTKAQKYTEAIEQLKTAKAWTTDQAVIQKLDGYIKKIEQERQSR